MIRGPYKGRKKLYQKAIYLRKKGLGYRSIAHKLEDKINWQTIKGWVKDIKADKKIAHYLATEYFKGAYKPFNQLKKDESRRRFLIRERGHKCEKCNLTKWLGKKIPLELHHEDGNKNNNKKFNLFLFCPNCHTLTPTYKGKNIK